MALYHQTNDHSIGTQDWCLFTKNSPTKHGWAETSRDFKMISPLELPSRLFGSYVEWRQATILCDGAMGRLDHDYELFVLV